MGETDAFKDYDVVIYNGDNELISNCVAKSMLTAREIAWSRRDIERPVVYQPCNCERRSYHILSLSGKRIIHSVFFIDDASIENVLNCLAACLYLMTPADQITERMARLEPTGAASGSERRKE